MTDALSIALSGLNAQKQRVAAVASNIANATTVGRVPTTEDPATTVYKPVSVSLTALQAGGVAAQVTESPEGHSVIYDPSSFYANAEGLVAAPNVDLAEQLVDLLVSKSLFKANAAVIKTQDELNDSLLDIIS